MPEITLRKKIILMIFGMFFCLAILEISLRLGGSIFLFLQGFNNDVSIQKKSELRILCLGESTTALGGNYAYPNQLERILNKTNIGIKIRVINVSFPGCNTSYILKYLEGAIEKYQPQLVLTMMGINDTLVAASDTNLLYKLRVYRLARLIDRRIQKKIEEVKFIKEIQKVCVDKRRIAQFRHVLPTPDYLIPQDNHVNLESMSFLFNEKELSMAEFLLYSRGNMVLDQTQNTEVVKRVFNLNPQNVKVALALVMSYISSEKFTQAESVLKKAIEFNPSEYRLYLALAICYSEMRRNDSAKEYYKKADELKYARYLTITRDNFKRLKGILDKRGIGLVCVQYPMRSIEPLKRIFEGEENVIFVDNEDIFKEAVKKDSYNKYFWDLFAGDFGHCTLEGNRLLAENIAHTLIKEYF